MVKFPEILHIILSFGHRPIVRNIDNQSLYVEQWFISWSFQNVWRPLLNLWSIFFRLYNTLCTSLKVKNTDANPAIQRCKGFIGPKKGWVGGLRDNEGRARLYKCFIVSKKAGKLHFRSSCRSTCVRLGLNLLAWWHRVCLSDLSVRQTKEPRSARWPLGKYLPAIISLVYLYTTTAASSLLTITRACVVHTHSCQTM